MKNLEYNSDWSDTWKRVYKYDLEEIYNSGTNYGYKYAYKNRFNTVIDLIQLNLPKGSEILDVAAAQGNFSLTLAELGYKVYWNDLREELIEYVKLKYEKGDISFLPNNIFELNPDKQFDAIVITEVIEHVAHPDEFLKKISNLVKVNGFVIMTTPNGHYFKNSLPKFSDCKDPSVYESIQFKPNSDGHIFALYLEEIQDIAQKSNLKIIKLDTITNPLTNGHIKLNHLLKLLPEGFVFSIENLFNKTPLNYKKRFTTTTCVLLKK